MAIWQCCSVIFRQPRHNALNLLQEHRSNNLPTPRFLPALGALRQQKVNRKWGNQASATHHATFVPVYNLRHKPLSCPWRPWRWQVPGQKIEFPYALRFPCSSFPMPFPLLVIWRRCLKRCELHTYLHLVFFSSDLLWFGTCTQTWHWSYSWFGCALCVHSCGQIRIQ